MIYTVVVVCDAATFTPMDENGDVNLSVIDKYADWIASTPVKGVFVCGTTGEFSSLTIGERKAVLEKWVASAAKRFKVIAHVGSNCQRDAMELASHASGTALWATPPSNAVMMPFSNFGLTPAVLFSPGTGSILPCPVLPPK